MKNSESYYDKNWWWVGLLWIICFLLGILVIGPCMVGAEEDDSKQIWIGEHKLPMVRSEDFHPEGALDGDPGIHTLEMHQYMTMSDCDDRIKALEDRVKALEDKQWVAGVSSPWPTDGKIYIEMSPK